MGKPASRPSSRTAKRRAPKRSPALRALIAAGGLIASNPGIAGGTTAFLVTLGFISANALWYQPHVHEGVFFSTRPELVFKPIKQEKPALSGEKRTSVDAPIRKVNSVPVPKSQDAIAAAINGDPVLGPGGDPEVAQLQQKLLALGFYNGTVDGISGKGTRAAIEAYRKASAELGVEAEAPVGNADDTTASIAVPAKKPDSAPEKATVQKISASSANAEVNDAATGGLSAPEIVRVQAGLRAFGNDKVEIDGKVGESTKIAVSEFQKLFRLPVTGEPDAKLLAKMQEIGLIN
ncbi:peptidoglycan hydrolase-like protein with peptidoglycan-binding domain [Phyllobacterium ifriqiyense]|uniref:Peptidoglycan hydrolase-like protein with peptidoglycan-binding domain n=1 Tax=Phyllobacterium ifriqiyense TaxID=314238 RepID=A0ABU0SCT0_9HYPH|nr:peptidoglycan-binding domain-containing protein [Phyllobacterium ifriqiyense]MDQ0998520.1 peptidoglycan hydrolase-like protein with peptidoglycan-binding domain [Phyllobacterium ifriqiyense]